MDYTIIKGTYHVAGFSPDGDSVRFKAKNPSIWKDSGLEMEQKSSGLQLRLEGIDALETHYQSAPGRPFWHQPRAFSFAAMEEMLRLVGISDVVYNLAMSSIKSAKDGTLGTLAVLDGDRFDRPVSLLFAGDIKTLADGAKVPFLKLPMKECVNLKLLKAGLAYPAFYYTTPVELIELFAKEAAKVRKSRTGIWALDRSEDFTMWNEDSIVYDVVIYPKLFRRLVSFMEYSSSFADLEKYLEAKDDKLRLRSTGEETTFAKVIAVKDRRVTMSAKVDDMIFDPKG